MSLYIVTIILFVIGIALCFVSEILDEVYIANYKEESEVAEEALRLATFFRAISIICLNDMMVLTIIGDYI